MAAARLVPALARFGVRVTVVTPFSGQRGEISSNSQNASSFSRYRRPTGWSLLTGLRTFRRRVRLIIERLDPDLVHAQELVPYGIAGTEAPSLPRILTAHGNMREDTLAATRGVGGISRAYVRDRLARSAVQRADVVIGVNPEWTVNVPCRPRRFVYIPNIVDERFYEIDRTPEPGLVLFLGGTRTIKGWPLLAAAWPAVAPQLQRRICWSPAGRVLILLISTGNSIRWQLRAG